MFLKPKFYGEVASTLCFSCDLLHKIRFAPLLLINEAMNEGIVYADVSTNWERLLRYAYEYPSFSGKLVLSDDKADKYDFSNEILMRAMHTQLVEAHQAKWKTDPCG